MATEVNYAEQRGDILREVDGLRAEVDPEKRIGYLILTANRSTSSPMLGARRSAH